MKKILYLYSIFCICSFTLLASEATIYSYLGLKSYHNSFKNDTKYAGIYASLLEKEHKFEFGYEASEFTYWDYYEGSQKDLTFIYSNYSFEDIMLKIGAHYILKYETKVYMGGLQYKLNDRFRLGVDTYVSSYKKLEPVEKVLQTEPYIGYTFGDHRSDMGSLDLKMKYQNIKLQETRNEYLQTSYHSASIDLTHNRGRLSTNLHLWIGERLYSVGEEGFLIYNYNQMYTSGVSASMLYQIQESTAFKIDIKYEKFQEKKVVSNLQILTPLSVNNADTEIEYTEPYSLQLHMGINVDF